jgi:hypothetical protein
MMSKTWLVTGGGRGLGRHIVEVVLAAGDNLVATYVRWIGNLDVGKCWPINSLIFPFCFLLQHSQRWPRICGAAPTPILYWVGSGGRHK